MNILLIMCDQLAASVLGCYGGPVPTPHLDRLAKAGVVFDNAVCPFPVCSPSRASIVTGLYPHTHGIAHNVNKREYPGHPRTPPTQEGLTAADVTTEAVLHAAGYQTHHYGKWHLRGEDLPYYPDMFAEHIEYGAVMEKVFASVRTRPRQSWMDWHGWALPVQVLPEARAAAQSGELEGIPYHDFVVKMGKLDLPTEQWFDVMVADRVVDRLANLGPEPFMLTCSFNVPHDPNVVPAEYYEMVDPAGIELPPNTTLLEDRFNNDISARIGRALGQAGIREFLRIYHASVRLVDDQIGRVLDALEATGRANDTIVVFCADHGDMVGAHGMVWKSVPAFYDEIARVPLIVAYPPQVTPGRSPMAASLLDLMPTLLDLVEIPVPGHVQGRSLKPYLGGQPSDQHGTGYVFCERLVGNPGGRRTPAPSKALGYMVRGEGWKYIRYRDGEEFLYHLDDDPGETTNLAHTDEHADQRQTLRAELNNWIIQTNAPRLEEKATGGW